MDSITSEFILPPEGEEVEIGKFLKARAAKPVDAKTQCALGNAYAYGKGVAKDEVKAVKWYRKAAEQGDAVAQFNLGVAYAYGRGVAKNLAKAVNWYEEAADQGMAEAQFNLGEAYASGKGVDQDHDEARNWKRRANGVDEDGPDTADEQHARCWGKCPYCEEIGYIPGGWGEWNCDHAIRGGDESRSSDPNSRMECDPAFADFFGAIDELEQLDQIRRDQVMAKLSNQFASICEEEMNDQFSGLLEEVDYSRISADVSESLCDTTYYVDFLADGKKGLAYLARIAKDCAARINKILASKEAAGWVVPMEPRSSFAGHEMVEVLGGELPGDSEVEDKRVGRFLIGKYEVTWGEWKEVREWAERKGYQLEAGKGGGEKYPVTNVNWHSAVKWCNARSEKEGLVPVYEVGGEVYRKGSEDKIGIKVGANGYRLPEDGEWEWAARGGVKGKGCKYSGSNDLGVVGWYDKNSGKKMHEVGTKKANELGIYDMSGSVWEWCFDWWRATDGSRVMRGGSWSCGGADGARVSYRNDLNPHLSTGFIGFRVARSSVP
jgi:formylglycine-generating enzyme